MMRRVGGFLLVALGVALMIAQGVYASERGGDSFDALVKGLSARYSVQPKTAPLMWMVSLCARGVTHGGVRGMRVVEFEDSPKIEDALGFEELVSSKLGEDWSRVVREWEASGNQSLIYVRAQGKGIEMIVVDLDRGELDLVKMTMNPEEFAKWTKDKGKGVGFQ
jgi:hypothetical protein